MTRERYESISLHDLREIAKNRGMRRISTLKKADLIDAMLSKDEEEARIQREKGIQRRREEKPGAATGAGTEKTGAEIGAGAEKTGAATGARTEKTGAVTGAGSEEGTPGPAANRQEGRDRGVSSQEPGQGRQQRVQGQRPRQSSGMQSQVSYAGSRRQPGQMNRGRRDDRQGVQASRPSRQQRQPAAAWQDRNRPNDFADRQDRQRASDQSADRFRGYAETLDRTRVRDQAADRGRGAEPSLSQTQPGAGGSFASAGSGVVRENPDQYRGGSSVNAADADHAGANIPGNASGSSTSGQNTPGTGAAGINVQANSAAKADPSGSAAGGNASGSAAGANASGANDRGTYSTGATGANTAGANTAGAYGGGYGGSGTAGNGSAGYSNADAPVYHRDELNTELDSGLLANGILEVMQDGFGFIRCANYMPGENDIYVAPSQIRRFGLKTGDIIVGNIRVKTQGEKFSALLYVKSVNGFSPDEATRRYNFEDMTPVFPDERIRLERAGGTVSMRIMDLMCPVGKGQRGMIVSPPKAGKTTLIKEVARSVKYNNPEIHLIVLLIDERPEEVTDIREAIEGPGAEVIYSTFDELPEHHKRVSEMAIERARRLVEHKKDVMILLDSITRLTRAYNITEPSSGRTLSGGLDPAALHMPKRFFGAARNMREGGSLTILATALIDTGSKMDDIVFEEFKGTGNMELVLDRRLSERRIFPAIDIVRSGTRRDDLLLTPDELSAINMIRRAFNGLSAEQAVIQALDLFSRTRTNGEFVNMVRKIQWGKE